MPVVSTVCHYCDSPGAAANNCKLLIIKILQHQPGNHGWNLPFWHDICYITGSEKFVPMLLYSCLTEDSVMRNQKGFTLIELLIVIVIIGILAAVAIPRFQGVSDKAKIGAAKAELATIKNLLGMYQAENDTSAYPATGDITSMATLQTILSPYGMIPAAAEAAWAFNTYARATEDTFVLTGKANDRTRTVINVTPTVITP